MDIIEFEGPAKFEIVFSETIRSLQNLHLSAAQLSLVVDGDDKDLEHLVCDPSLDCK